MSSQNFSSTLLVNEPASEVFKAINNVSKWWTENIEGNSKKLNDEFTVRFGDIHVSTQKLVELVSNKKVVWLVTYSQLNFVKNKSEWIGTKINFEIEQKGKQTQMKFTHSGLVPAFECFQDCSNAWSEYIQQSLLSLITTGKGQPTPKEGKAKATKK